jgi:hypothetical protein
MSDKVNDLINAARSSVAGEQFFWVVMDDFQDESDVVYATLEEGLLDLIEGRAARIYRNDSSIVQGIRSHVQALLDRTYKLPEPTSLTFV